MSTKERPAAVPPGKVWICRPFITVRGKQFMPMLMASRRSASLSMLSIKLK